LFLDLILRTQLEVQAHQVFARGYLQLELAEWQNALATFSDVSTTFATMNDVSHDATFVGFVAEIQSDIVSISTTAMRSTSTSGSASAISSPHRLAQAESTSSPSSRKKMAAVVDLIGDSEKTLSLPGFEPGAAHGL
jgi:hypothetical protein